MEESDMIWKGKKVYVRLKNSRRSYSGKVISETDTSIIIKDIKGHTVEINKDGAALIQEEE